VQHDLNEGRITQQRAKDVYGVVFDEKGDIDKPATAERRKALAKGVS